MHIIAQLRIYKIRSSEITHDALVLVCTYTYMYAAMQVMKLVPYKIFAVQ